MRNGLKSALATMVAVFFIAACPALANFCETCKVKPRTAGFSECHKCGGWKTSGANQSCPECSRKLGVCECCGAKIDVGPAVPGIDKIEASTVTLDMKSAKVTAILTEIEKQTGNQMPYGAKINDVVLDEFKADNEGYWQVLDRLCRASGNWYGPKSWEKTGGG